MVKLNTYTVTIKDRDMVYTNSSTTMANLNNSPILFMVKVLLISPPVNYDEHGDICGQAINLFLSTLPTHPSIHPFISHISYQIYFKYIYCTIYYYNNIQYIIY